MAGEDISMESSKLKHRKMDRDDRCDGISNLPDAVLLHILSFLPMRDAVRTVMVPGFRYLWTSIRDLSFDHCAYHDCNEEDPAFKVDDRFVNFIDHVLTLHENPTIDWFRLSLNYAAEVCADDPQYQDGATKETRKSNKIDTWINFAVRRKVKFLDLNFLACTRKLPNNLYMLPSIVLSCSYLVELTLASCVVEPVGQVQLRSLRKLFMKQIDLTDKKLANILSGSPLLKELSLEDCDGLCEPKFCSGPSIEELNLEECGSLKKLDLTRSDIKHLTIDHSQHLELICPNVKILDIAGCLTYVKVTNMPSLVDTSICFSHYVRYSHEEFSEFRLLLEKLNCSPYFMPCDLCMLVLTMWELINHPCPSFTWKHVTLHLQLRKWYLPGICNLLRNSHLLETLAIYVYTGRIDNESEVAEQGWKPAFEFNGFSYWSSVDGAFPCLEHQLKHVKIYGSVIEPDVIELIEFLLKNAQILEKMEISTKKTLQRTRSTYMFSSDVGPPSKDYCTSDALLEFSQKLLSFPRALTRAVIHLG
ncbi:putative F-box/LRR-repeat protein At3g18150 isoform X1 [Rhodamnia argentea]|uniref:F-box/LRR-repeat protein At3g18150 isoform X1 n=1 Tax=Rhodamnia argentea TaxID=178133 RepID=A0A8B8PUG6_9MYRT|nr:putative F-box/LRR-repeat protein At3g18150 isoform X1 [Rhodamnia argentea]